MKKMTYEEFMKPEKFILTSGRRVQEDGKKTAKRFNAGEVVNVSENDKIQLLASGQGVKIDDLSEVEIKKIKADAKTKLEAVANRKLKVDELTKLKAENAVLAAKVAELEKKK